MNKTKTSKPEPKAPTALAGAHGYAAGVEIYEGFASVNLHNCAVKERTADGVPVGPCCHYLENGTTCPRHGLVKPPNSEISERREPR